MPNFAALSKAAKIAIEQDLEKTIEVNGRTMKQRDIVEWEIENKMRNGFNTQADIMKALDAQGVKVDPNYVKERLAVARRRDPRMNNDPTMRKMEAEFIIQKNKQLGSDYDTIMRELTAAGFNGPKIVDQVKAKDAKRMATGTPVVIDDGSSGPNAGEEQPPVFDPEGEARRANKEVMDNSKKSLEEKFQELLDTIKEADAKRYKTTQDMRAESQEKMANDPFVQHMEGLVRSLRDSIIPTTSRIRQNDDPVQGRVEPPTGQEQLPSVVTDPM